MPYQSLPEFVEGGAGRLLGQRGGRRPAHDDHVDGWQLMAHLAKALADQPLEPVAIDRQPGAFFRDGETEPRPLVEGGGIGSRTGEQGEGTVRDTDRLLEDAAKLPGPGQARVARKPLRPRSGQGLRGQAFAALGAASGQDLAAAAGAHTGTKAVGAGAFQNAGLKSTLHGFSPPIRLCGGWFEQKEAKSTGIGLFCQL